MTKLCWLNKFLRIVPLSSSMNYVAGLYLVSWSVLECGAVKIFAGSWLLMSDVGAVDIRIYRDLRVR